MLKIFLLGFVIYNLGYTMSLTANAIYIICDLMRLIGVILIVISSIKLIVYRFDNLYLKIMYTFYMLWLLAVVFRGLKLEYVFIKNLFFNPAGIFLYCTPLILLIPKPPKFYKLIFNVTIILAIFFIIHMVWELAEFLNTTNDISRERFDTYVKALGLPCGFLLMTFKYQPKRNRIIALVVISITFLFVIYRARRGLIFMSLIIFIFTFLMFIYHNKRKIALIIFSFITGSLLLVYTINASKILDSKLLTRLNERGTEDTRSGVEDWFYNDMKFKDWVIGRGMSGMVAAPAFIDKNSDTPGYRTGVETDYLTIILKGGIISLGLLLLIAIPAIIQGLFLSKNTLSKAAALWILLWLISIYPSTVTLFTLNYTLVWIAIGICYSKLVRNMSDEVLKEYFINPSKNI
ncbi:hypothetical protein [uncultured Maribacter sp.]|uniref:hypothetical protein n=1 Tax=uncultured Maribacter sp. TaxID=431308 RepID=UPI00261B56EB|nr:hypothetical protein [uncultured Maribacter sp.]